MANELTLIPWHCTNCGRRLINADNPKGLVCACGFELKRGDPPRSEELLPALVTGGWTGTRVGIEVIKKGIGFTIIRLRGMSGGIQEITIKNTDAAKIRQKLPES